jgi:two-component system phosphate regulon sensor histidine kinase PhoR|tara:strand:- start:3948 stop:5141 length:1194 start_codon:yes stop_codon:yes gene_type:complete
MIVIALILINLILISFFDFKTILIILFFEFLSGLISFVFIKRKFLGFSKFPSSQRSNNSNIDDIQLDKYYQKLMDHFDFPIFFLDKNLEIKIQNNQSILSYGQNVLLPVTSVIRDYEFIENIGKFKKNSKFNNFIWKKELPEIRVYKAQLKFFNNFIILQVLDFTQENNSKKNQELYLTNLTHELKTPLSVIIGYLETINFEEFSLEENKYFIQIINSKSFEMKNLIDQMLKLSEVENLIKTKTKINVFEIINRAINNYRELFKKKSIILVTDIDIIKNLFIDFTPNDLDIVLNNLLSNALNYSESNTTVTVLANLIKKENQIEIIVKDQGIGISDDNLTRITEKFYRVDKSRNNLIQGHGLGLAITREILANNGCQIDISSVLGKGSDFKIIFSLS